MLSAVPQAQNYDLLSSPDPKNKENLDTIISILAKSPKERQPDELRRLATFLQRSPSFANFWSSVPQGIHQNLLRGIRYSDIKPNKPVFPQGEPAKGLYFIIKGTISAFITTKQAEHSNVGSLEIPTVIKQRGSTPTKTSSLPTTLTTFDFPAFGIENNDPKSIMILDHNSHCESAVLGEDDCFGELVSDIYKPKLSVLISKENCYFAVLSLSYYKKTLNDYNKTTHRENIEFVRNISLVQDWSSSDLTDLLKHSKTSTFNRNHVFYDIGDPCEFVYLIHEGEVEMTKETKLNIEDEDIFNKASLAKHSQDVDRARLANLNPLWKKKFSMAKRQQTRVALLGACQSFGEEEVNNQIHTRSSKAVVKSLTARVLVVPVEKIFKTSESEPTTQTNARSASITQLPLSSITQEKAGEGDFSKYVQAYNQDSQREPLTSSRHKRSSSYSSLGQQQQQPLRKVLGETNSMWNKQAFSGTKNFELPNVQSTIELKENINNVTKTKTPTMKSPRGDVIISNKETIKIGGINRLWESNRHAYFAKSKKTEQTKMATTTTQGESMLLRQKSSASFLPDTSRPTTANMKKTMSSRHLEKPVIINNFAVVAKRKMTLNSCEQAGTPSSRSKEVEDDSQADTKLTSKLNISRIPIGKIRGSSCDTKTSTASQFYIKKLGKVITAANSFREHSTGPVKLDDGWNKPEVFKIKLSNIKSPINSTRDTINTATDRFTKTKTARNSLTVIGMNQFIS